MRFKQGVPLLKEQPFHLFSLLGVNFVQFCLNTGQEHFELVEKLNYLVYLSDF